MNAQPQAIAKQQQPLDVPSQRRLVALVLFESSRFNHSDTITAKPAAAGIGGAETSIVPARLLASGDWAPCKDNERPDGFGLEQYRGSGKERKLYRGFVTLAAVKELVFAE